MKFSDYVVINPKIKFEKKLDYPFVEMKDLKPYTRSVYSSNTRKFNGSGSKFKHGDTLLARITPCLENGKTSQYKGNTKTPAWGSTEFIVLRGKENLTDSNFIYYLSISDDFRRYAIQNMIGTSGRQRVPNNAIEEYEYEFPDLTTQKAIAQILGTLDDKIELNQKMNQTLEDIAKAIFKSWFVDFDPVRAKAEGNPTGLPDEISDLFPDEFVSSELGEMPNGWSVKILKDMNLEIESGKRPEGGIDKDLIDGIPSVGAESIDTPGVFDFSKVKYIPEEFALNAQKGWVKNYDVALYKDGAFVSKVSLYGDDFPFSKFMVNEHVFLLRSIKLGQFFLYRLFFSDLIKNQLIAMGTSKAAQPGLNKEEVASCAFICPTQKLSDYFNKLVNPLVKKQLLLGRESQILGSIRDALLPKLISGELQIPDAEKFLKDAGI